MSLYRLPIEHALAMIVAWGALWLFIRKTRP